MVNWALVRQDTYYRARQLEEKARAEGSPEAWQEFADLKVSKGSYLLAVHGYLNAALRCEELDRFEQAFCCLNKAFQSACLAKSRELATIVAYRHALMAERKQLWNKCIEVYEALGQFCEELGNYFLAADAYEHVAEIMAKTGMKVADYAKPIEMWRKNAQYWRDRGHEDDAQWSEDHLTLYQKLFVGVQA